MKTSDFFYHLPQDQIAQTPIEPRDSSKLLVVDRGTGKVIDHSLFKEVGKYLNHGDLLVLNETRVIPARLFANKIPTGGRVEILLLHEKESQLWECLIGGKGIISGKQLLLEDNSKAVIIKDLSGSRRIIKFENPIERILQKVGKTPLPPYIHKKLEDPERYQTIYANKSGSAAAPTAGLHFTQGLINNLSDQGINFANVVLHVGLDTFAPVREDNPENHEIHSEWCQISEQAVAMIVETRRKGNRVVAVGTTSVRVLETAANKSLPADGKWISSYEGYTKLFILPGFKFKAVDALITNFHLPESTLIMLVSAFMGREKLLETYQVAVENDYRFYSFGDSMLII